MTIGTVKQVSLASGNTATATITVNAAASLGFAAGTDTITATYGGDSYNATSSGTTTVTVSNPALRFPRPTLPSPRRRRGTTDLDDYAHSTGGTRDG